MQVDPTSPLRVLVVAPPVLGWGLDRLVGSGPARLQACGVASSLQEARAAIREVAAHVVVLGIDSPIDDLSAFCAAAVPAKVMLVTSNGDSEWLDAAVLAGVRGVVRPADAPSSFLSAVETVGAGGLWLDQTASGRIFVQMARRAAQANDPATACIAKLTQRERQTVEALLADVAAPGKRLAETLCISEHTLRNHLTSIYSKLGVANRLALYEFALKHRLDLQRD